MKLPPPPPPPPPTVSRPPPWPSPPIPACSLPADLMHGYQFATPRAILHIGWYWTIHHTARHRHIAHPPLTLQMLLPTSARCVRARNAAHGRHGAVREKGAAGRKGEGINASAFRALSEVERIHNPRARRRRRRGAPRAAFVSSRRRDFNDPDRHWRDRGDCFYIARGWARYPRGISHCHRHSIRGEEWFMHVRKMLPLTLTRGWKDKRRFMCQPFKAGVVYNIGRLIYRYFRPSSDAM